MLAVIPAAGEGARLAPITSYVPKPLLPVGGRPVLIRILDALAAAGVDRVLVTVDTAFKAQFTYHAGIWSGLSDPTRRVDVQILDHDGPLGTAGELLFLQSHLPDAFLVHYGDILSDLAYGKLLEAWSTKGDDVLGLLAIARTMPVEKGLATMVRGRVTEIREKPTLGLSNLAGIGVLRRRVLRYAAPKEDLHADVLPRALEAGERIDGFLFDGAWWDVGTWHSLKAAQARFQEDR